MNLGKNFSIKFFEISCSFELIDIFSTKAFIELKSLKHFWHKNLEFSILKILFNFFAQIIACFCALTASRLNSANSEMLEIFFRNSKYCIFFLS